MYALPVTGLATAPLAVIGLVLTTGGFVLRKIAGKIEAGQVE